VEVVRDKGNSGQLGIADRDPGRTDTVTSRPAQGRQLGASPIRSRYQP